MNHVFCMDCGNKISFSLSKPSFCSKCGAKMGTSSSVGSSKKEVKEERLAEDETSIDEVPFVGRLDVDVEQYENNVFTMDSLAGRKDIGGRGVRNRGSKTLEDFIDDKRG